MHVKFKTSFKVPKTLITNILLELNKLLELKIKTLYLHILSDQEVLEINKKYLNHTFFTDIITFDLRDEKSNDVEIYISLDRIKENSLKYKTKPDKELFRVCIHGMLHLSGLGDKTLAEKRIMRKEENRYLNTLFHVK